MPQSSKAVFAQVLDKPRSIRRLWIICALIYLYFAGGYLSNTMTNAIAALTVALIDDQSILIKDYTQHEEDIARYQGRIYAGMPPGLSFLLLPVYGVMKIPLALVPQAWMEKLDTTLNQGLQQKHHYFRPAKKRGTIVLLHIFGILFLATPLTLLIGIKFKKLTEAYFTHIHDEKLLLALLAFLLLGTGLADFTATLFHTTIATALLWIVFVKASLSYNQSLSKFSLFWMGLALGTIPTLDHPAVVYSMVLFPAVILTQKKNERLQALRWLCFGTALPIFLMGVYHTVAFGKPWLTAYHMRVRNLNQFFEEVRSIGPALSPFEQFLVKFFKVLPDWERVKRIFTDSTCNLPIFNPLLPLGLIASATHFIKNQEAIPRSRWLWATAFLLMFMNLGFYASIPLSLNPSGGSYGARYTIYSTPFGLLACTPAFIWAWSKFSHKFISAILILFSLPAWMYLFYGSPNRSLQTYLEFFLKIGPSNYTLFKAHEAGLLPNPLPFTWGGFLLLLGVCYGIWVWDLTWKDNQDYAKKII